MWTATIFLTFDEEITLMETFDKVWLPSDSINFWLSDFRQSDHFNGDFWQSVITKSFDQLYDFRLSDFRRSGHFNGDFRESVIT